MCVCGARGSETRLVNFRAYIFHAVTRTEERDWEFFFFLALSFFLRYGEDDVSQSLGN